jgi:hypothetical protein
MAIEALGAYDALGYTPTDWIAEQPEGSSRTGLLLKMIDATRAALDPEAVSAAADSAKSRSLEVLVNELIVQPARHGSNIEPNRLQSGSR